MSLQRKAYRVGWIGPASDGGQDLLDRFSASCVELGFEPEVLKANSFDLRGVGDLDRVVLASVNRADYPDQAIRDLIISNNIVPWGVMTNSWHLGGRRSGQGAVTHWQQPWFRWWESWFGWFFPEAARPGSLVANTFSPIVTPLDFALPTRAAEASNCDYGIAILCACGNTANMLKQQAMHAGWSAVIYRSIAELSALSAQPECIVWDDTSLPCLPAGELKEALVPLLNQLDLVVPNARRVTSLGLENMHLWTVLRERGCVDLLVKPSAALGLSNLLFYRSSQRQLA